MPEATDARAIPRRMRRSLVVNFVPGESGRADFAPIDSGRVASGELAAFSALGAAGRFSSGRFSDRLNIVLHVVLEIAFPPPRQDERSSFAALF